MYCLLLLGALDLICFDPGLSFREEDILISMLRLLEYERATVDAEGAIGLAALVAGKLPELKGKRYSTYSKLGTVAETWDWAPWLEETVKISLFCGWPGNSCPWTGKGFIGGRNLRLTGPVTGGKIVLNQTDASLETWHILSLCLIPWFSDIWQKGSYSSTRHHCICQDSVLPLSACCLLLFHLWNPALSVVGQSWAACCSDPVAPASQSWELSTQSEGLSLCLVSSVWPSAALPLSLGTQHLSGLSLGSGHSPECI